MERVNAIREAIQVRVGWIDVFEDLEEVFLNEFKRADVLMWFAREPRVENV
jgi:hypothetical protein